MSPSADEHLWTPAASRASQSPGWNADSASWSVRRAIPGPFRVRISFLRGTALGLDTPVLESPALDDLTILYERPGPPRTLAWLEQ